jgi:hypothetical protein
LAELDLTEALAGALFAFDSGLECLPGATSRCAPLRPVERHLPG